MKTEMEMVSNASQTWRYSKKYPKGRPIFFINGRQVSIKKGKELYESGFWGAVPHLKEWFSKHPDLCQ